MRQLVATLETLGSARWVLIDSNSQQAARAREDRRPLDDPERVAGERVGRPAGDAAGRARIREGQQGRAAPRSGSAPTSARTTGTPTAAAGRRFATGFAELPQGVRFHLLAYPQTAADNLSVRVTDVRRQKTGDGAELLVSLRIMREGGDDDQRVGPGSVRDRRGAVRGDGRAGRGAGRAQGPSHPARERPRPRLGPGVDSGRRQPGGQRLLVRLRAARAPAGDRRRRGPAGRPAACNWPRRSRRTRCSSAPPKSSRPSQLAAVDWDQVSLLLWQAPLPDAAGGQAGAGVRRPRRFGDLLSRPRSGRRRDLRRAVDVMGRPEVGGAGRELARRSRLAGPHGQRPAAAGRPARRSGSTAVLRAKSRRWRRCGAERRSWRGSRPAAGRPTSARPRRRRPIRRWRRTASSFTCWCSVRWPAGRRRSGNTRQLTAGEPPRGRSRPRGSAWPAPRKRFRPISRFTAASTRTASGCWRSTARPAKRRRRCWPTAAWPSLFKGLDFARVDDKAGSIGSLIQEIWRLFLVAMMVAMVAEAALCLPKVARPGGAAS